MRVLPHLPPLSGIIVDSGIPDGTSAKPPRVSPQTLRRAAAVLFLSLGIANVIVGLAGQTYANLIPGLALLTWGVTAWRTKAIKERVRPLDILCILVAVPLFPFYLNYGAVALWGQEWWELPLMTRLIPLTGATIFASVIAAVALRLQFSEARYVRRRFLAERLYEHVSRAQDRGSYEREVDDLLARWLPIKLPLRRCAALIAAGIEPENATSEKVRELSDENLRAIGWLATSTTLPASQDC